MKFKIITNTITDKSFSAVMMKTFEYFATINKVRAEKIEESMKKFGAQAKESLISLIQDLVDYVESGLKSKYSENFNVIASETPNFALKYEKGCLLSIGYLDFVILVFKTPHICVPSKYMKQKQEESVEKQIKETQQMLNEAILNKNNFQIKDFQINPFEKIVSKLNQEKIGEVISSNIAYHSIINKLDKDFLGILSQGIQNDLSYLCDDFSFGVIVTKRQLISSNFFKNSNLLYHCKINENAGIYKDENNESKSFESSKKLKNIEIFIYHKKCKFESVLGNMISGRLSSIEFKHYFIVFSVIAFFIIVTQCKSNIEEYYELENLSWFEENVCKNKPSVFSTMGIMFIMIIVSGVLKKKIDKKKNNQR